jgi:hypothetical protein
MSLADRFEAERARLTRVAYGRLGSLTEAEEIVQDAWLRLRRVDAGGFYVAVALLSPGRRSPCTASCGAARHRRGGRAAASGPIRCASSMKAASIAGTARACTRSPSAVSSRPRSASMPWTKRG